MLKILLKQIIIEECLNNIFNHIHCNFLTINDKIKFYYKTFHNKNLKLQVSIATYFEPSLEKEISVYIGFIQYMKSKVVDDSEFPLIRKTFIDDYNNNRYHAIYWNHDHVKRYIFRFKNHEFPNNLTKNPGLLC